MSIPKPTPAPGRITDLRFQKKNPERINLFIDGRFAMGLPAIEAARLKVGQMLGAEDIERLHQCDAQQRGYEKALRFLSYRPRSITEVRGHLQRNGVEESHREAIVEKLLNLGYLDDQIFARWWVENRREHNPRGAYVIRHELRVKGVSDDLIDEVLERYNLEEEGTVEALARTRARRLAHDDQVAFRRKLGAFLFRRGFSYEDVKPVIDRLWQEIKATRNTTEEIDLDAQEDED